jgi:hypothetical protein
MVMNAPLVIFLKAVLVVLMGCTSTRKSCDCLFNTFETVSNSGLKDDEVYIWIAENGKGIHKLSMEAKIHIHNWCKNRSSFRDSPDRAFNTVLSIFNIHDKNDLSFMRSPRFNMYAPGDRNWSARRVNGKNNK